MSDENSWRTNTFRQSVVTKIDEAIRQSGMNTSRNSIEMENHVFQKAKNKEEYLGFVARLILHVREMNEHIDDTKSQDDWTVLDDFVESLVPSMGTPDTFAGRVMPAMLPPAVKSSKISQWNTRMFIEEPDNKASALDQAKIDMLHEQMLMFKQEREQKGILFEIEREHKLNMYKLEFEHKLRIFDIELDIKKQELATNS